jgi:hypothetical protein
MDTDSLVLRESKLLISNNNSRLSNSDPRSGRDNDLCSSEDEQGSLSTSKHSRWSGLNEQRLLAYKKEGKP